MQQHIKPLSELLLDDRRRFFVLWGVCPRARPRRSLTRIRFLRWVRLSLAARMVVVAAGATSMTMLARALGGRELLGLEDLRFSCPIARWASEANDASEPLT